MYRVELVKVLTDGTIKRSGDWAEEKTVCCAVPCRRSQ